MNSLRSLVLSLCGVLALGACTNFDANSEVEALNEVQAVVSRGHICSKTHVPVIGAEIGGIG